MSSYCIRESIGYIFRKFNSVNEEFGCCIGHNEEKKEMHFFTKDYDEYKTYEHVLHACLNEIGWEIKTLTKHRSNDDFDYSYDCMATLKPIYN